MKIRCVCTASRATGTAAFGRFQIPVDAMILTSSSLRSCVIVVSSSSSSCITKFAMIAAEAVP